MSTPRGQRHVTDPHPTTVDPHPTTVDPHPTTVDPHRSVVDPEQVRQRQPLPLQLIQHRIPGPLLILLPDELLPDELIQLIPLRWRRL